MNTLLIVIICLAAVGALYFGVVLLERVVIWFQPWHIAWYMEILDEEYADHMEAHQDGHDLLIHGWSWPSEERVTNWNVLPYRIRRVLFLVQYRLLEQVWGFQQRRIARFY